MAWWTDITRATTPRMLAWDEAQAWARAMAACQQDARCTPRATCGRTRAGLGTAKKRRLVWVLGALIALGIGIGLWRDNSSKRVLPDGTVLMLSRVQIGRTNVYLHGTKLSKLLGNLVPSNGVSVGRFQLQRARTVMMPAFESSEFLTAELWLAPGSPRESVLVTPPFYRKYRLLILGDRDDYAFVKEFNGFRKFEDGLFAQIWASSFPRDSERLRFRLEERETGQNRDWREVATFVAKNPKPARLEPWKPEQQSRLKLPDDLELEVGVLTVRHQPIHPTDIWENTAELPIRITDRGRSVTIWGVLEGRVRDNSGNSDGVPASLKLLTNDWMMYRIFRPLDPAKLWKFQVRLGRDADFPATNLFSFVIPFPLAGPVQTNLGGLPCRIEFVNTKMLSVQLTNKPQGNAPELRERSGSRGQQPR